MVRGEAARAPAGMRARIVSVDILRGLVIVLMVLDHVRDYLHTSAYEFDALDPARTTAIVYATRWVTHFCAPTFVFLAGASVWLQRAHGKGRAELARFLVTRGLWLIVLELTVLGFGWSFSLPYLLFLQVIWAIGWGMVLLAALLWLPRTAVLAAGVAIIAGHDLLDGIAPGSFSWVSAGWTLLYVPGVLSHHDVPVALVIYPILPWFGVMAFGYGLGQMFLEPPRRRD
ncbi:MAG TPA: heparan-alpha-glucosaminide N-acetyltransferase domain-containing protein, partial [Candidatus Dormibacteraeota bacterium]|nr:heparan-alpha-glucosaminide N-acetyltransferase domain-containing protein [Candidatus Dormibacteraeota bacterium]